MVAEIPVVHIKTLEALAVFLILKKINPKKGLSCSLDDGQQLCSIMYNPMWVQIPSYLAGVRKVVAEALTRIPPLEPEWSLDQQTFQFFLTQVPGLQVDLFATAGNHQLPL